MNFCTECGVRLAHGDESCPSCGHVIDAEVAPTAAAAAPAPDPVASARTQGVAAESAASQAAATDREYTVVVPRTGHAADTVARPAVDTPHPAEPPPPTTYPTPHPVEAPPAATYATPHPVEAPAATPYPAASPYPPSSPYASPPGATASPSPYGQNPYGQNPYDQSPYGAYSVSSQPAAAGPRIPLTVTVAQKAALVGLITFAIIFGVWLAFAALVSLLVDAGAPVDWFRAAAILVGMSVGAPIGFEGRLDGSGTVGGSLSLTLIVGAIGIVAAAAFLSGRAEAAEATATKSARGAAMGVSGATFAVPAAIIAALASGPVRFDPTQTLSMGVHPFRTFLGGLFFVAIGAGIGRFRASTRQLDLNVPEAWQAYLLPFRLHARVTRDFVVATFILTGIAITGLIVIGIASGSGTPSTSMPSTSTSNAGASEAVLGFLVLAMLLVHAVILAAGFLIGGTFFYRVDGAFLSAQGSQEQQFGMLAGGLPGMEIFLMVLLALVVMSVVGLRSALRFPRTTKWFSLVWPPALSLALIWAIPALVTRVGASGSARELLGGLRLGGAASASGSATMGIGLPSTMMMAAFWAAFTITVGVLTLPYLAGSLPALVLRLGGKALHPEWRVLMADSHLRRGLPVPAELSPIAADLHAGRIAPPANPLPSSLFAPAAAPSHAQPAPGQPGQPWMPGQPGQPGMPGHPSSWPQGPGTPPPPAQ